MESRSSKITCKRVVFVCCIACYSIFYLLGVFLERTEKRILREKRELEEHWSVPDVKRKWVYLEKGSWSLYEGDGLYIREFLKKDIYSGMTNRSWDSIDRFKSYNRGDRWDYCPVVYIGPWEYDPQLNIKIRSIKRQKISTGAIDQVFESIDEKNENILPMELTLVREDNTPFYGRPIPREENERIVEELLAKGYRVPTKEQYKKFSARYRKESAARVQNLREQGLLTD